ncbi:MAG: oligosaccharide flippase family protein, partial [Rubripirellula sp.]
MSDVSKKTESESSFVADSLAIGMAVMLAMTIIQRGLGFFRGIWFCRLLDDAVVGQWSMAYDFITMITPVMLLGIPGTLPRYVEHYRVRGHLTPLVRRMLWVTIGLGAIFFVAIMLFPDFFGWLVFLQPQSMSLVYS